VALLAGVALAALALVFAAKSVVQRVNDHGPVVQPISVRVVPVPPGWVVLSAIWSSAMDGFVLLAQSDPSDDDFGVFTMRRDGTDLQSLPLPPAPNCARTEYGNVLELWDGRIAYRENCFVKNDRLMAYDPRTGTVAPLRPYSVYPAGSFTFSPDLEQGIVMQDLPLRETFYWLRADYADPLRLPIERAGSAWWSPDGRWVAVEAAPQDQGTLVGVQRLDLLWTLYLLDPTTTELRPLVGGLHNGVSSTWSPDGKWLAAAFDRDGTGRHLSLIHVASGRMFPVAVDGVVAAVWLPDGRTLLTVPHLTIRNRDWVPVGPVQLVELPDLDALEPRPT
jgi:hypothetical protein